MLKIAMFGQKRIPSREGGVEIVVEELATRMVQIGHDVTCYNRKGHHVSGAKFDIQSMDNYKGIKIKIVPTIEKKRISSNIISFFCYNVLQLLESMMLFMYMQRDQHYFVEYLNCFIKELL